jgi:hypothetical protein
VIPGAETFVIDRKFCASLRRGINHRARVLAALRANYFSGKTPKHEFKNDRAEEINPSCHRQQRRCQENAEESQLLGLRKQGNLFRLVECRHFNSHVSMTSNDERYCMIGMI